MSKGSNAWFPWDSGHLAWLGRKFVPGSWGNPMSTEGWERLSLAVVGNQEDRLAQMRLSLWFGSMAKPL